MSSVAGGSCPQLTATKTSIEPQLVMKRAQLAQLVKVETDEASVRVAPTVSESNRLQTFVHRQESPESTRNLRTAVLPHGAAAPNRTL